MRPLIGISTYREQARWGVWDQRADLLPTHYAASVERAGGVPVLLPPTQPWGEAAHAVLSRLDGLLVAGGADVDPTRYGEPPHPATGGPRPDRDAGSSRCSRPPTSSPCPRWGCAAACR